MATLNITLPDSMKAFIEQESANKGFRTVSEYVRSIISDVQQRQAGREKIDALLIESLDSGPAAPLTPADWNGIRDEIRRRHSERRGRTNGPKDANRP
jgi:antitoxin ParD1/3/4